MALEFYSDIFLSKNSQLASESGSILYRGEISKINKIIDNRIELLDSNVKNIDSNVSEGLQALVFDHYVCKRIINNKKDIGIVLYLNRIIDVAFANKNVFFLDLFLPFKLPFAKIKGYLNGDYIVKYNEIIRHKNNFENKIGNILKIDNGKIYFDNGNTVSEDAFLRFLIVNIPTDNSRIKKLQDKYYLEKNKQLFSNLIIVDGKLLMPNGLEATVKNMGFNNLLIHFFTKYGFYEEIGDNRYYDVGPDKSMLRDNVVFNYCYNFGSDGYAYYQNGTNSGNFSIEKILNTNCDILFFLVAITHEARHAVQYNCKDSRINSVRNAHLETIMTSLNWNDYGLNYHGQSIEHDANRKALFIVKTLMSRIGRNDIKELVEKRMRRKVLDILLDTRTDKQGNTKNIWEYEGNFIDGLSTKELDRYPELEFLFNRNGDNIKPIRLIDLFSETNLNLKGSRLFESSFIANYVRYRSLQSNELDQIVKYMLSNNVSTNSLLFINLYGLIWNLVDEGFELSNNVVTIIKSWKREMSKETKKNSIILIDPFFSRIETQLELVSKLKMLSQKYPSFEHEINYIIENMYVMLKNLMIYYEELKNSFEKNSGDYLFVLKNHYRILLFLNKFEGISDRYLDKKLTSNILKFKADIIGNFNNIANRIRMDSSLSEEQKNKYLTICFRQQGVTNISDTNKFVSEVFKPLK